jgi:ribose transport system permease protein
MLYKLGLDRFSGFYLLALFIVVFGVWTPDLFLSMSTMHTIASQQAITALVALAIVVPLVTGSYDLSVGANVNLTAIVVCSLQVEHGVSMWPAVAISVGVGVVVGFVNGFIIVKLRVSSLIATLGTSTLIGGTQIIVTGGSQPLPPVTDKWSQVTQFDILGFQVVVVYLIIVALVIWWLLDWTPAGRYMYAVGGNEEAARLSGVRVGYWKWTAMTIGGGICGLAGVLYASLSGPSLTFGAALLLPAFAAAFLGSTQLQPGRFNVWGTLLAIFVLAVGVQGLQFVTSAQWLSAMFNGAALILAVALAGQRRREVTRRTTRAYGSSSPAPTEVDATTVRSGGTD